MSVADTAVRRHIVGLDAWRAALMLGGLVLHGSIGLPTNGLFRSVDLVSQTFRMGAFYGIAGVLTAVVLARRAPDAWIRRRVQQLGIPLVFGLAVISPFIWLMASIYGWPVAPAPLPFEWHHLWFLAGLILYSLVVYALARSGVDDLAQDWLEARYAAGKLPMSTVLLVTTVTIALLFGIAPIIMNATMSTPLFDAFRTIQLVAGYLPMFLLGYLAGRSPLLCAAMLGRWRASAFIVVGVAAVYTVWFGVVAPGIDPSAAAMGSSRLRFLSAAICPPAAFVLILRSASSIRRVPPFVARISRASYTIYLLHLPIAVSINLALHPLGLGPYLSYLLAVTVSSIVSFAFHEQVVVRSPIMAFLLNGKPPARAIVPTDASATPTG